MMNLKKLLARDKLPTFIIIGAMKAGTSSLHNYLNAHPEISMSKKKETDFFLTEDHGGRDIKWYKSQFDPTKPVRGETSPNYTKRHYYPGVPERMHKLLPNIKLIYVVRDPIDRLISNYMHAVNEGKRSLEDFSNYFGTSKDMYLDRERYQYFLKDPSLRGKKEEYAYVRKSAHFMNISCYYYQISAFLEFYDLKNILVISSEDLKHNRLDTLKKTFAFLGVDENFVSKEFNIMSHKTDNKFAESKKKLIKPKLAATQRNEIINYLKPDIDKFRKLTGQKFDNWSV